MNYFELYPGDYLRDTSRLSLVEHGAYLRLLMAYYAEEQPLPADYPELYVIAGAISSADKGAVRKVADRYFPVGEDGQRHNSRADAEIEKAGVRMVAADERKGNDAERKRRSRNRRAQLFAELQAAGVTPDAMVTMEELRALHAQHVLRNVTRDMPVTDCDPARDSHGVTTGTTRHTPQAITPDTSLSADTSLGARAPCDPTLPAGTDPQAWAAFQDHHREKGSWTVARAMMALGALRQLAAAGANPTEVLTWATVRGLSDLADCHRRMQADAAKARAHDRQPGESLADASYRRSTATTPEPVQVGALSAALLGHDTGDDA